MFPMNPEGLIAYKPEKTPMTINGLFHDTPRWLQWFGKPRFRRWCVDIIGGNMFGRWEYSNHPKVRQ